MAKQKRLTENDKAKILELKKKGNTIAEIAKEVGCSDSTVFTYTSRGCVKRAYAKRPALTTQVVAQPEVTQRPIVALIGSVADVQNAVRGLFS